MARRAIVSHLILIQFFVCCVGCGGGTSGTGLNAYEGTVVDRKGSPVQGMRLTIESTGDSTESDERGDFLLHSSASGAEVSILAEQGSFSQKITVKNVFEEHSRVRIALTVDAIGQKASNTDFNVKAGMVGICDYYFENRSTIRQANQVPSGTVCTLKVDVLANGSYLDGATVALQYASCGEGATWTTLSTATTGEYAPGSAKISFEFASSAEFCRYRLVAPYHLGRAWPILYPIDTFAEQAGNHKTESSR